MLQICYCRNCDEPFYQDSQSDVWQEYCPDCRRDSLDPRGLTLHEAVQRYGDNPVSEDFTDDEEHSAIFKTCGDCGHVFEEKYQNCPICEAECPPV